VIRLSVTGTSQSRPKVSDKNSYKIGRFILSFLVKVKKDIL